MKKNPEDLSFFDHFEELRNRLVKSILAVLIAACFFYAFVDEIFALLIKPVGKLVFTAPGEAFVARIMLAFFGGIFMALPVILYQIWRFVAAGLEEREVKYVRFFAPCSFLLFVMGGLFAYFIIIPISIRFLLSFSTDLIVPMITIKSYISFIGTLLLAFGVIFELPLILMFLTKIGITTPAFLAQKRKHAVVIVLIVSALITPPDFVTQLLMAAPLVVLYEAGIMASKLVYKKK